MNADLVTQYTEPFGVPIPNFGTTGDDRMDLAHWIGADLIPDLGTALAVAERVLTSGWYAEVRQRLAERET